ncbi:type VII secretion integral membrane protein EccD [Rhodococcus sp. G-MC3]|uniref:type VII secretion integral membrane protein EccD n=1 Tax=Rhodococcus sp. G-MC3 TaxID=3046209 RepID=UPI0024B887CC|nr:type VII secretion integral membrane protein EccD [Rhodococcus sp. G-MC3]MDJ0392731.1 type VII secretion integral membrane protein EccD [Rhodococcus sp. G-MC3]
MTGNLSQTVGRNGTHAGEFGSRRNDAGQGRDERSQDPAAQRAVAPLELCRLTILAQSVQVDLALPTNIPVALLVPGIVEVLGGRSPSGHAAANPAAVDGDGRAWVLSKVGQPPLDGTVTLDEASIRDGELLVLGAADNPAPPPLFDDLMHAVATSGTSTFGLWTATTARFVGFGVGALAVLLGCLALARSPFGAGPDSSIFLEIGVASAVAGILFVVAGSIVTRVYHDGQTGVFLSCCALPLAFTAGIAFVPGSLGAPHLLLGASTVGVTAALASRLGGHGAAVFTGTATAAAITVAAALVLLFTDLPIGAVGAGTAVLALAGLASAPRLSMMQARLPLPPVPTAGATLDEVGDDEHPGVGELENLSRRARSYLTGLVYAGSCATTTGALLAALMSRPDGTYWPGIALALLVSLVLILRGRTFAEVQHAIPLVAGGTVIGLALLGVAVFASPPMTLGVFAVALGITVVAVIFGSVVPTRDYSPVLRRSAELIEYSAIAAVLPLACWVCGLYSAMRGL